jgi:hypothetical protein
MFVMVWPQFRAENNIWKLNPDLGKFKTRPTLDLKKTNTFGVKNTVVYGRAEQKVWREIVVLTK